MPCMDRKHAAKYEKEFLDDLQRLGCLMPSLLTRVSDFIPEIRAYIDKIHENGMAYATNGSVYLTPRLSGACMEQKDDKQFMMRSSMIAVHLSNCQNLSLFKCRWREYRCRAPVNSPLSLSSNLRSAIKVTG